jgi:hypothetical protein
MKTSIDRKDFVKDSERATLLWKLVCKQEFVISDPVVARLQFLKRPAIVINSYPFLQPPHLASY